MGINQCTSIQNNKHYIDFFETKLKSSTSVIQFNIVNEYNEIKQQILKKRKLKDLSYIKVSTKYKSISSYISLEKQKDIFHQWFSLIGNNIINEEKKGEMITNFDYSINRILTNIYVKYHQKFVNLMIYNPPKSIRIILWKIANGLTQDEIQKRYNYYEYLLFEPVSYQINEQIKKDLNRTFFHYEVYTPQHIQKLYNILKVFSNLDKDIGYCQGINFIVKVILQCTNFNEADAFSLLTYIFENIRGYFLENFPLLQLNIFIFDYFFNKLFNNLFHHFSVMEIPYELWVGKWMQTLYTIYFPIEITIRLFDCLLAYGFDFVIFFSLSIVKHYEKELMTFTDLSEIIEFFREIFSPVKMVSINEINFDNIVHIDKIISYAKELYTNSSNKGLVDNLKKEFLKNSNFDNKIFDMKYEYCYIKSTKTFTTQTTNDLSFSSTIRGNTINNSHTFHKIFSENKKEEDLILDDINIECEECGINETMNTKILPFRIMKPNTCKKI